MKFCARVLAFVVNETRRTRRWSFINISSIKKIWRSINDPSLFLFVNSGNSEGRGKSIANCIHGDSAARIRRGRIIDRSRRKFVQTRKYWHRSSRVFKKRGTVDVGIVLARIANKRWIKTDMGLIKSALMGVLMISILSWYFMSNANNPAPELAETWWAPGNENAVNRTVRKFNIVFDRKVRNSWKSVKSNGLNEKVSLHSRCR